MLGQLQGAGNDSRPEAAIELQHILTSAKNTQLVLVTLQNTSISWCSDSCPLRLVTVWQDSC